MTEPTPVKRDRPKFKVPRQMCPACWHKLDVASVETSKHAPVEGDITLCIHCAAVLVWGQSLKLRLPDELEAQLASSNQTIGLLRASIIKQIKRQEFA